MVHRTALASNLNRLSIQIVNLMFSSLVIIMIVNHNALVVGWSNKARITSSEENDKSQCSEDVVIVNGLQFKWKNYYHRNGYAISEPNVCWNDVREEFVIRQCDRKSAQWNPKNVTCSALPPQLNKFCPEDLIEINVTGDKYICIAISQQPHQYETTKNICYGSDVLAVTNYLKYDEVQVLFRFLKNNWNINTFWLPVIRRKNNRINPYRIHLPGSRWGELFEMQMSVDDLLSEKYCLAATYTEQMGLSTKMEDCTNMLYSVCVYREHFVATSGCPQGFAALSYKPNVCYGIDWSTGQFPLDLQVVTFAEYFAKRNILKLILGQTDISKDEYFIVGGTYNEYSIKMNIKGNIRLQHNEYDNTGLSSEILRDKKDVQMTLKVDMEMEKLILTVYNRNYIWRVRKDKNYGIQCFTNADYDIWRSVKIKMLWENNLQTKTIFEVKLVSNEPGYYWCEAHTIFNFDLIITPQIVVPPLKSDQHTFVTVIDVSCITENRYCENIFSKLKPISKSIDQHLKYVKDTRQLKSEFEDLEVDKVIAMAILSVASDKSSVKCLCHITFSHDEWTLSLEDWSDEIDDSIEEDTNTYDISTRLHLLHNMVQKLLLNAYQGKKFKVRSTDYCFRENFVATNGLENQWLTAKISQTTTTKNFCLQENGLPITRKCEGDFINGGYWQKLSNNQITCLANITKNLITKDLFKLVTSKTPKLLPEKTVRNVVNLLEQNLRNLIPADLYYMARIMEVTTSKFIKTINETIATPNLQNQTIEKLNITTEATSDVVRVYNYLMQVDKDVIKPSSILNTTNILLESFERLIDEVALDAGLYLPTTNSTNELLDAEKERIVTIDYHDVGVVVKIVSKLVIFIIDPNVANVTGIALLENRYNSDVVDPGSLRGAFGNESYRFLLANQSVDDLLFDPDLQLATYVPETLLSRLDEISIASNLTATNRPDPKIVIKVYSNDKLFQENDTLTDATVFGNVISISIPGHDRHLPELMPLIMKMEPSFNNSDNSTNINTCRYWNYKTWANDGLVYLGRENDMILCGTTHLTPFAYLLGANYKLSIDYDEDVIVKTQFHKQTLDIISLIGCYLSLFGIIGIFITAAMFQTFRQKPSSKLLLQLCAAIGFHMILFCFVNTEENRYQLLENGVHFSCIAIGACLQYSVLVEFSWMLIIAYMQFQRYVKVFESVRPKKFFFKTFLLGWGLPLIPTLLVLLIDKESYTRSPICYPSGWSLYFGVLAPIAIVIVANLIIFVCVIYSILRGPEQSLRRTERKIIISQIRLSVLLFFLLGFTWIFGLLAMSNSGLVFSYLFSLTATIQGFVLFVYFIVLDPTTRRLWIRYFRRCCRLKDKKFDTSTTMKETSHTFTGTEH